MENTVPVLLSAVRTPSGRFQGSLSHLPAPKMGALVVKEAVARARIDDPAAIQEVIMGNVVSAGLGQNPARQSAIYGDLPASVGAYTVNKVCGSGLKAVMLAAQGIQLGEGEVFVAGGMESMSRAPFLVEGRTGNLRFGHVEMKDALLHDGLWDPFEDWGMGNAAEFIADEYGITREEMDAYAYGSHQKALAAIEAGKFTEEIVPIKIPDRKGQLRIFETDETPRRDTTPEVLAKLPPAFVQGGKVTAGNSPGLNDGASALVVASLKKADSLGVAPLARIVGSTYAAVEPKLIFYAPAIALPNLLEKVGWSMKDVDLIELNEAFAAQVLADGKALADQGWDWEKVNVHGGAIALGHPIGASGARVLTTLIYALKDRGLTRGVASLCLGGAEAVAMAVEII